MVSGVRNTRVHVILDKVEPPMDNYADPDRSEERRVDLSGSA